MKGIIPCALLASFALPAVADDGFLQHPRTAVPLAISCPIIEFDDPWLTGIPGQRLASADLLAQSSRISRSRVRITQYPQSDSFPTDYLQEDDRGTAPDRRQGQPRNVTPREILQQSPTTPQPVVVEAQPPMSSPPTASPQPTADDVKCPIDQRTGRPTPAPEVSPESACNSRANRSPSPCQRSCTGCTM
jgi:hypothetical protein